MIRWIQQKRRKWNNRGKRPILTGGCRQVFSEWRKNPTKSDVRSVIVQSIVCPDTDCESCDTKAVILFSWLLKWLCIFGSNSKWDLHRRKKYLSFNSVSLFTYVWQFFENVSHLLNIQWTKITISITRQKKKMELMSEAVAWYDKIESWMVTNSKNGF